MQKRDTPKAVTCPKCEKPPALCVCERIAELGALKTAPHVLILQHPQEPDRELGTARLAHLMLPNSTLRVGLSWPNPKAALGRETQPSRWAVLYLGSGIKGQNFKPGSASKGLVFVDKKGAPVAAPAGLDGIVVLDGSWSQAKALWWRNAWLLKLKRAILQPSRPSLYGALRREPRGECLSTIESIGEALVALGEPEVTGERLRSVFATFLERVRAASRARLDSKK